jgi:hypothetical protein
MAGVRQLPLSLGASIVAITTGGIMSKTGKYKMIMIVGWTIMVISFGLMTMLDESTSV